MMYSVLRLTTIKGSYYLCKCHEGEHNALLTAIRGHEDKVIVILYSLSANRIWNEIEANESLREQEYMFITYTELVGLLKEVFGIEVG